MGTEYVLRIELVDAAGVSDMRVSPRMAKLLKQAAEIGRLHTGTPLVGTETVLRALTDDPDGIAGQVLEDLGIRERTRNRLDEILRDPNYTKTSRGPTTT